VGERAQREERLEDRSGKKKRMRWFLQKEGAGGGGAECKNAREAVLAG
jgi:hypothetical protein